MFKKLLARLNRLGSKPPDWGEIRLREDGFDVHRDGQLIVAIDTGVIQEISAFKRDWLVTDLVCFQIHVLSGTELVIYEVNEEMRGFDDLVKQLERLPGFLTTWRKYVIVPAFATQWTKIYPVG